LGSGEGLAKFVNYELTQTFSTCDVRSSIYQNTFILHPKAILIIQKHRFKYVNRKAKNASPKDSLRILLWPSRFRLSPDFPTSARKTPDKTELACARHDKLNDVTTIADVMQHEVKWTQQKNICNK
jgi:hypothetical protein